MKKRMKGLNPALASLVMLSVGVLIGIKPHAPLSVAAVLSGAGTEENPYLIATTEDLQEVITNVDNAVNDYDGQYLKITSDLAIELAMTTSGRKFNGHLDGDHHILTLSTSAVEQNVSMFYEVGLTASVKNITFAGSLSGMSGYCAPVCVANSGTIDHIVNQTTIIATSVMIGGIAVKQINDGAKITNCVNQGAISGNEAVGGIVGRVKGGTVSHCLNQGNVTGSGYEIAGIAGYVSKNGSEESVHIENCLNEADISGAGLVGGIIGRLESPLVCNNCSNYGDISVTTTNGGGGIIGTVSYVSPPYEIAIATLTNCYASGTVHTNNGYAGGILGIASYHSGGTINFINCLSATRVVNTGASGLVGGFTGGQQNAGTTFNFDKCQTLGSIFYTGGGPHSIGIGASATKIGTMTESNLPKGDGSKGLQLSETTLNLLRAVREFNCVYDAPLASKVSSGLTNLTTDEQTQLSATTFYKDNSYGYVSNYYHAALYVDNFMQNPLGGVADFITRNFNQAQIHAVSFVLVIMIISSITWGHLKRRRESE
ncbi:MAG: hypothetical protein ACOX3K_05845 [Bacilli bacterium]